MAVPEHLGGPGMTLATDIRLATEVCRHVAARLRPRVLVADGPVNP